MNAEKIETINRALNNIVRSSSETLHVDEQDVWLEIFYTASLEVNKELRNK